MNHRVMRGTVFGMCVRAYIEYAWVYKHEPCESLAKTVDLKIANSLAEAIVLI